MSDFHADFADALLRGDEDALAAHLPNRSFAPRSKPCAPPTRP
jgi:hypothetical protein